MEVNPYHVGDHQGPEVTGSRSVPQTLRDVGVNQPAGREQAGSSPRARGHDHGPNCDSKPREKGCGGAKARQQEVCTHLQAKDVRLWQYAVLFPHHAKKRRPPSSQNLSQCSPKSDKQPSYLQQSSGTALKILRAQGQGPYSKNHLQAKLSPNSPI